MLHGSGSGGRAALPPDAEGRGVGGRVAAPADASTSLKAGAALIDDEEGDASGQRDDNDAAARRPRDDGKL